MKIRHGFVSNSSSSSFIVAYKGLARCSHCGETPRSRAEKFFDAFTPNKRNSDTEINCIGAIEICSRLGYRPNTDKEIHLYGGFPDPRNKALETALRLENEGYKIIYFDLGYHETDLNDEFRELTSSGEIKHLLCCDY